MPEASSMQVPTAISQKLAQHVMQPPMVHASHCACCDLVKRLTFFAVTSG